MNRRLPAYAFLPITLLYGRWRPAIRILMYHRVADLPGYDQLAVSTARFEEQMAFLARGHRVISLAHALDELDAGGPSQAGVAVTFDDGYRDNLEYALPILRQHAIPATIFVTTAFCDQSLRHPRYPREQARLHLDWDEVRALSAESGITIGSHTLTHPFLSRVSEARARAEIGQSRELLAQRTGRPADFFCYPSGDFVAREIALVKAAGYRAAVSVAPGGNRAATPRFALRRTEVTDRDATRELTLKLEGAFDPVHAWLHARRERSFARARTEGFSEGAAP